jgi:hypothetical protein
MYCRCLCSMSKMGPGEARARLGQLREAITLLIETARVIRRRRMDAGV